MFILCFIYNTRLLVLQIRFQEQFLLLGKNLVRSVVKNKLSNFTKKKSLANTYQIEGLSFQVY